MAEQICLVGNPQAGSGQAHNIASAVQERLRARGFAVRTVRVVAREEVSALAESAGAEGETLVAIGGDGIIAAAADGLRRAGGGRLGVIPAGRGNDLARTLGIPRQPTAACEVIAAGATRALDLGVIGDRAFIGIASVGFDSEANRAANEAPAFLGGGAYAYGAMRALARWRPAHFEVIYREAPLGADGASQRRARTMARSSWSRSGGCRAGAFSRTCRASSTAPMRSLLRFKWRAAPRRRCAPTVPS